MPSGVEKSFKEILCNKRCPEVSVSPFSNPESLDKDSLQVILQIQVGDQSCQIIDSNETAITCIVGPSMSGAASVQAFTQPWGQAECNFTVMRSFVVTAISPASGSLVGTALHRILGKTLPDPIRSSFASLFHFQHPGVLKRFERLKIQK